MAGVEAFLKGWVSRMLPQAETDNDPGIVRLGRFGDVWTIGAVRKQHGLADEGSYFVANNGGAGIATAAAPTAFSDTAPMVTIYNTDSPGNQNSKRIHLDVLKLLQTAAGTAGVSLRIQVKIGNGNPGGTTTDLTPQSVNMDVPSRASIAIVKLLPTSVVMTSPRTVIGDMVVVPTLSAAMAIFTSATVNFGGVESGTFAGATFTGTTAALTSVCAPPIVIGPNQGCVINFLIVSQSGASSWTPELAWWER